MRDKANLYIQTVYEDKVTGVTRFIITLINQLSMRFTAPGIIS